MKFAQGSPEAMFRELDRHHRHALDACLAACGLSEVGNPMLLAALAFHGGTVESQRDLADFLHVTPATVTVSLKSVERLGYVKKLSDENDMRRKRIALTEKGWQAIENIDRVFEQVDSAMYDGFTAAERAAISGYFERMIFNLKETDPFREGDSDKCSKDYSNT